MTAVVDVDLFHDQLTTAQAALLAGVDESTIRQWKRRGHLRPVAYDLRGRPRYLGIDVAKAEKKTRTRARRTR